MVRGPPSQKLRTLREVISADRIARSRSDPVFVLQVPAARLGSAGGSRVAVKGGSKRLVYYLFDILYLGGFDLREAALVDRKRIP